MNKLIKIAKQFANDLGVDISNIQVAKVQDKIILSSGDNLRIITAVSKAQIITQLQNKFKDTPEQIEQILNADPHPEKAYSIWIGKLLISKNIILPEDSSKIIEKINLFNDLKKRDKIKGMDINRLKTYQELASIVDEASGTKTQGEAYRENLDSGQELIFQDAKFKLIKITTTEASAKLCRGTEWCVKDPKYAESYLEQGPLILVYYYNSPFALIHKESGSAKNIYDKRISDDAGKGLGEIVDHLGIEDFKEDLKVILRGIPDDKILSDLDFYSDEAFRRELISTGKYVSIVKKDTPEELSERLYDMAVTNQKRLPAEFEKYILTDESLVLNYIDNGIIEGRWPEGEAVLAKNARYSYEYAYYILSDKFPEGEAAIATNAGLSFSYAEEVLRGRFPTGEEVMSKDPELAYKYATRVINDRWPMGEESILKNDFYAPKYKSFLNYVDGLKEFNEVAKKIDMNKTTKIASEFAEDLGVDISNVQVARISNNIIFSSGDNLRIITAISKEQVLTQLTNKFKDTPEKIEQILQADPTPNKGYSIWIGKLLISKNIILPEDANKILDKINLFEEFKKKGKIKGVDINRLKTYQELAKAVEEANGVKTQGEEFRENLEDGQELIHQDFLFKVLKITTPEASAKLCRGTEWCVKDPKYAESYLKDGPLIMVYKNNSPYALIHEETGSAKDVHDEPINDYVGDELADIIEHLGITTFEDDLEVIRENISKEKILSNLDNLYEEANIRKLIDFDEYVAIIKRVNPEALVQKIFDWSFENQKRIPRRYEILLNANAELSYKYAYSIIMGRFEEAEWIISQDVVWACKYADRIIKGRWRMGEEVISKDENWAYWYANNVVNGRWPEGESAIARNPEDAYYYAINILNGRFPEAEPKIAEDAHFAYFYAIALIKGRWPMGERAILTNPHFAERYKEFIMNKIPQQ